MNSMNSMKAIANTSFKVVMGSGDVEFIAGKEYKFMTKTTIITQHNNEIFIIGENNNGVLYSVKQFIRDFTVIINEVTYELTGCEDYPEIYAEYALPEFKNDANEQLLVAIAVTKPDIGETVDVILEKEKAKSGFPTKFTFLCQKPDNRVNEKQITYCWIED